MVAGNLQRRAENIHTALHRCKLAQSNDEDLQSCRVSTCSRMGRRCDDDERRFAMEDAARALVAAAGAMIIKPVRERVIPVAKAIGRTGRDVGMTAVAGLIQVVQTARQPAGQTKEADDVS